MRGSSDELTREYLDRFVIEWRHLGGGLPSTEYDFCGHLLSTPIMAGGMAHYERARPGGAAEFASGVAEAGTAMWSGFCSDADMERIISAGSPAVRIIKPFADKGLILSAIEHDESAGAAAFAMDVDHVFDKKGGIYSFFDQPLAPQNAANLAEYARHTRLPFYVKGVLSLHDALICVKAGVAGIVLSHHQNMFPWSVPPLAVLPEIRRAVGKELNIIVDCGIETGFDAFKALALGADAVCVARPLLKEFASGGPGAVRDRLLAMTDELRCCLARTCSPDPAHIDAGVLREVR